MIETYGRHAQPVGQAWQGGPRQVDYLIIGAGIAGLSLRHFLQTDSVVLLDDRPEQYKIGESIIPEMFRHPDVLALLPAIKAQPSYSSKVGTTFIEPGSVASFPAVSDAAIHISRDDLEYVMRETWQVPIIRERVRAVDMATRTVTTNAGVWQVNKLIIDCSGPAMVLATLMNQVSTLMPVFTTWAYWDVHDHDPARFRADIDQKGWSRMRFGHQKFMEEDPLLWDPGESTILTRLDDGIWTWQIPLYNKKLLSVGVVSRQGKISAEAYDQLAAASLAKNYRATPRPRDGRGPYDKLHVRNHFARTAASAAGDGYILMSDAFCFADPVYSVGAGLAVNKAIEIATLLNKGAWNDHAREAYCSHYAQVLKEAIEGFQYWYDGTVLKDPAVASLVQDRFLIGNVFHTHMAYHYSHLLGAADLQTHHNPTDPFAVDWDNPGLALLSRSLSAQVYDLLGQKDQWGDWQLQRTRPAVAGLLTLWSHPTLPDLLLLFAPVQVGRKDYRTFGKVGVRYLRGLTDGEFPDIPAIGRLITLLAPSIVRQEAEWLRLCASATQSAQQPLLGLGAHAA